MSKLSKISKISKFTKITKILNHSCIIIFFVGPLCHSPCGTLGWGLPLCLQLNCCPCPPRDWTSYVYKKFQPFPQMGGGVSKLVLWGRMVLGVMPPVHVQGPVCPDHVAASAWLPVSWLCRFGCPPVQWCPVGRSPPCVSSIPEQWMITPIAPGTV